MMFYVDYCSRQLMEMFNEKHSKDYTSIYIFLTHITIYSYQELL